MIDEPRIVPDDAAVYHEVVVQRQQEGVTAVDVAARIALIRQRVSDSLAGVFVDDLAFRNLAQCKDPVAVHA